MLLVVALFGIQLAAAQELSTAAPAGTAHRSARAHKRPVAAAAPVEPVVVPEEPPAPELPKWPANEKPMQAAVTWDSHGLRIEAKNSSLKQIMTDVSTVTGASVEGLGSDERIFGAYGPGQARDVLTQLLQGAGYNILMVGDQGQGAPREIVLSSRKKDAAQTADGSQPKAPDEDADPDEAPPAPPVRPPNSFRTPQQLMQDMLQQRQQQMMQQVQPRNGVPQQMPMPPVPQP